MEKVFLWERVKKLLHLNPLSFSHKMNKLLFVFFALFAVIFSQGFAQWSEESTEGTVGEGGEGETGANEEGNAEGGEGEWAGEEGAWEEVDSTVTADDLLLLL